MATRGTLFVHQIDGARNATKWQCWGDTQTRLDLVYSEWVSFEEMSEEPAFQRVQQIVNGNRMYRLDPVYVDHSALLGGSSQGAGASQFGQERFHQLPWNPLPVNGYG